MSIDVILLANALTTVLSKVIEQTSDPALTKGLQDFFQRSYKRKEAERKLAKAIQTTMQEFSGLPDYAWLKTFVENLNTRPDLTTRIAEIAVEMKSVEPNYIPSDLALGLGIQEYQKPQLANFLFRLRQELVKIEGYSEAIIYTDNLYSRGVLTSIFNQVQTAGDYENRIEIKSGPTEIVASGLVIAFNGSPIEITYGPQIERLTLIFAFQDDEQQETRIEANTPNPNTLKLTLHNFKSPLGSGTPKPIHIGSLAGEKLYMHYRVYAIGNGDKTLHYTIYRNKEVYGHD